MPIFFVLLIFFKNKKIFFHFFRRPRYYIYGQNNALVQKNFPVIRL